MRYGNQHLTLAVSRANSRSEVRAKAVGIGSSALLDEPLAAGIPRCYAEKNPSVPSLTAVHRSVAWA